ncbi:Argonaute complex, subunit Arb1, partial [Xylariales sp. AK1849]
KKKKKSKRVGKTRRAITGFEEFYADPPTTPDEFKEEKQIYAPEHPFIQRIEECIQRYRHVRRLDNHRTLLFDKYLIIGGIDSSQRQFQGMDPLEAKSATGDEIRAMSARDVIQHGHAGSKFYDPDEPEHWEVDFEGIVKGFLSRWVPENYPRNDSGFNADNEQAANLIYNFLNYVLLHDVCPEYKSQIMAAKAICEVAPAELRYARELSKELKESFNTAARFLFCDGGVGQDPTFYSKKLNPFNQLVIFRITVMFTANDENLKKLVAQPNPLEIKVVKTKVQTYEVVKVRRNNKNVQVLEDVLEKESLRVIVNPSGTMILRPAIIDHAFGNRPRPDQVGLSREPTEAFFVDRNVLAKVQVGMKMELVVCELNIGIQFIKEVWDVRASFDTLLPQSLMLNWKIPVANERSAPSIHDSKADENGMDAEMGIEDL